MGTRLTVYIILGICIWVPVLCLAQSQPAAQPNTIVIKDHQFEPSQLKVPAGRKIQIVVENQDATKEEFESFDLDREEIIGGNQKVTIFIGPLKPGTYQYWADFHPESKGTIVAE